MDSTQIFERSEYHQRTINVFEVIASYFVDVYYNKLYFSAEKHAYEGKHPSTTMAYKHILSYYLERLTEPENYKKCLNELHMAYVKHLDKYATYNQCIDAITQEFVPEDFLNLRPNEKDSILHHVIKNSNMRFCHTLVNKCIKMIVDMHNEVNNVNVLQNLFIDNLIIEREEFYGRFLLGDKPAGVSPKMIESIRELNKSKMIVERTNVKLKQIIVKKEDELAAARKKIQTLEQLVKQFHAALAAAKEQNKKLQLLADASTVDKNPLDADAESAAASQESQPQIFESSILEERSESRRESRSRSASPVRNVSPASGMPDVSLSTLHDTGALSASDTIQLDFEDDEYLV